MEMTVDLFNSIINTSQDCVFWKDKDRRFVEVTKIAQQGLYTYIHQLRTSLESTDGFETALVVRIRKAEKVYGYLVCAVQRSLRIWQENECAVLYYVAGLLADSL